jgi:hypothetical protein
MKYSRDSDYNQHRSVQSLLLNDWSTIIKDREIYEDNALFVSGTRGRDSA